MDRDAGGVASLAEAWIEIAICGGYVCVAIVASLAEAWIEIIVIGKQLSNIASPPSRRRGLKSGGEAPDITSLCRLPRGGVD